MSHVSRLGGRLSFRFVLGCLFLGGCGLAGVHFLSATAEDDPVVGPAGPGRWVVPTNQTLTPAGRLVSFPGRPVDLAFVDGGETLVVKNSEGLVFVDTSSASVRQTIPLPYRSQAVTGLAVDPADGTVFCSGVSGKVYLARPTPKGTYEWAPSWQLPPASTGWDAAPTGLAFDAKQRVLYALSCGGNTLHAFEAATGKLIGSPVPVGVAPFGIVLTSSAKAYVSNWGGVRPKWDDVWSVSAGTPLLIDPRTSVASDGTISVVDLAARTTVKTIHTGLHPNSVALSADERFLYVACANSDEVDVIDTATDEITERIPVRPEVTFPFGSGPAALALSLSGSRLYVAAATNNSIAVVALGPKASSKPEAAAVSKVIEFVPVGWYPGALAVRSLQSAGSRGFWEQLFVANVKGQGSLLNPGPSHNTLDALGSVSIVSFPHSTRLAAQYTAQVAANNRHEAAALGLEPPRAGIPATALPERHGEPSLIKHVLYVIKENRTYDQVFGDISRGDGDPSLVMFGREVTPNQHALADEFVLLDNFYCAGTLSADGHQWATQAYVTDYIERHFGGWLRSYPYEGGDPLAYSPTGFLWDGAIAKGLTFRDYGEMVHAEIQPPTSTWRDFYDDYLKGTSKVKVRALPGVETLAPYLCETFVGFPLTVQDVYRAREFLKEFRDFEKSGELPSLMVMLLPNNHTAAYQPGYPTPRAMVADNDLALGQIVDAITHSRFWPETAIFVVEDDPQAGLDHVDGHRTIAQVISPFTRRGQTDHSFYTQIGMLKTIELILGLKAMNQLDLSAPPMRGCFQDEPDTRPYVVRPNQIPLDEMVPGLAQLSGARRKWALKSLGLDLDEVDKADEETMNRILWFATKGESVPYPARPRPKR